MAVNINNKVHDVFYRYRMPVLQTKVEGSGNGIKTVMLNLKEVAKALERPLIYLVKFFSYELGAHARIDTKSEQCFVNGDHHSKTLQKLLEDFINIFVLCGECDNPETVLSVKNSGLNRTCRACGFKSTLPVTSRGNHLKDYIFKQGTKAAKQGKGRNNEKKNV